ncbi:uncharacterized protein APUU_51243S [Aspergillus puulaauensis]|uniref:Uncharacterized protein n=1 Tax=Aspergillus puulaauensis TaxID=1220207 RepID=A0A7R8AQ14_9EURO|nr:uncharacterized protein APUU_51243S [Aspergillus puulaauensis]BCS26532.1 hypothetical protein APUU_51243S [Aspergillus puulaauensis]
MDQGNDDLQTVDLHPPGDGSLVTSAHFHRDLALENEASEKMGSQQTPAAVVSIWLTLAA